MDKYDKLRELKSLFDSGILTETEFTNLKNEIMFENSNAVNIKSESNEFSSSNKADFKETPEHINTLEAGKNNSVFNKGLIIASIIICIILVIKSILNSSDKPKTQIEFENARNEFYISYNVAPNEIKKSEIFVKSHQHTCEFEKKYGRDFINWDGIISEISTNQGGNLLEYIKITSTYNKHPVCYEGFNILKGTQLYNQIAELKKGDIVYFSFRFKESTSYTADECFDESSITELGSLEEPEFSVDFTNIKINND